MKTEHVYCLLGSIRFKQQGARGGAELLAIGTYNYCEQFLYKEIRENRQEITGEFIATGDDLIVEAESRLAWYQYEIQNMQDVSIQD